MFNHGVLITVSSKHLVIIKINLDTQYLRNNVLYGVCITLKKTVPEGNG